MVEDDTFTYHVKQQFADHRNTAAPSLITKERTQKLDLLIHLLSNLPQALAVCGPEGIGKTTLLKVLQERKTESWRYCLMQGDADLSFEAVQGQLAQAIGQGKSGQSLSMALGQYESQHKQVVLIVDNAGELVPGLIAAVIQYAAANPVLKVIFALTHDELQVKRGSDRVIDDCHIVEIPPLSEKQCGDFLQYLSTKPYANLSFKAIGENMIAHIYRETHGVPGRIIAEITGLSGAKQDGKLKWILGLSGAAAMATAFAVHWWASSSQSNKEIPPPASVERKADNIEIVPPQPEAQIRLTLPPAQPGIQPQVQSVPINEESEAKNPVEPPSVEVNAHKDDQQTAISTAKSELDSPAVVKPVDALPSSIAPAAPKAPVLGAPPSATMPLEASPEKPKLSELTKAGNDVEPSGTESPEIKPQPSQISAEGVDRKPSNKQADVSPQKMAERLWAAREKLKQAELLGKAVNSAEPSANNLELIQIPQKPAEVAPVPVERSTETTAPLPAKPIGSLPIATLPPPQAVEESQVQPASNFTLQLMVLSKQSSVDDILKKYPAMEPDIRVINVVVNGKEKFILEYGSYSDTVSANQARQSLPFEFRRALVRKLSPAKHR
jgi:DamX protein